MPDGEKVNILVVDDLPEKLMAMELILEDLGQNVVTVLSGREALRRLLEQDFAVILLDVHMPDMDGFETARLIRLRKRSEHTPIIFITGMGDEMAAAQGYSLGAVDYILSPVVPEILRTKVGVFVELFEKQRDAERQAEERVALAREQALRSAAEEAGRRSEFLAGASTRLAASLDLAATRAALLHLAVPALADAAGVTLLDDRGQPGARELAWRFPPSATVQTGPVPAGPPADEVARARVRVLAGGPAEVVFGVDLDYPVEGAPPGCRLVCAAVLPLRARGRTLGAVVLASCAPRYGADDLALAEDLAGRAATALDNARLYRAIHDSDRRKDEFLAMLAHELRNPLAPIRNAAAVLRTDDLAPDDLAWARDVIERQVRHLARLVDDLLDVSRITRGKVGVKKRRVELAAVVTSAVETSRPLIDERGHTLAVTQPPEPVWLDADPDRLAQVLANLLNNAAKFTPDGGKIELTVAREAGGRVRVRVRDNGAGIPADQLGAVFELFAQGDSSLDRRQGGLGIGLTLVKRLVELHGGRVEAASDGPNRGAEFAVTLPTAEPGLAEETPNAPAPEAAPRRVLVVDDNQDGAESLAAWLRRRGHEVRVAYDGPAALVAVGEFTPEAVLLDIGLPGMNGYEVARRIRAAGPRPKLLAALSGYDRDEDRRQSKEAGFDLHLVKPVPLDYLDRLLAGV